MGVHRQDHLDLVHRLDKAQAAIGGFLHLPADLQQQAAHLALDVAQAGGQGAQRGGDVNVVNAGFGQHVEALQVKARTTSGTAPVQGQVEGRIDLHADIDLDRPVDGQAKLLCLGAKDHFGASGKVQLLVKAQAQALLAHDHLKGIGTGPDGRQPVGLQVAQQAPQAGLIDRAVHRRRQVVQVRTALAHIAACVVTDGQDAVSRHQLGQRGAYQRQIGGHGMVVDVVGAHRIALRVALELRRNRGLEIAQPPGNKRHAVTQQVGQQGVELTKVDSRTLGCLRQRHLHRRATDVLAQVEGSAQGIAAHLHLAGQVHQRGVNDGGGRALHGIARLAVGRRAQQHQQAAILQLGRAQAAGHREFGGQVGNGHTNLAALIDHRAVDQEITFEAGHAQHLQFSRACQLKATIAVKTGGQVTGQAEPRHTHQFSLTADRALPAPPGQQVQRALHIGEPQTDCADHQAQAGIGGAELPAITASRRLQRQPKLPVHARFAQLQLRLGLDVHLAARVRKAQHQVGADVAHQIRLRPVDHCSIGGRGHIGAAAQCTVDLQAGLADLTERIAGHAGLARGGAGTQPAASLAALLGGHHRQQVDIAQAGTQAAPCAQGNAQVGPPQDELVHRQRRAVAQTSALVVFGFQEQVALGREHAGYGHPHATAYARLAVDQRHLVKAVCGAHRLGQVAAPAVEGDLQALGRDAHSVAGVKAQVALGLHRVAGADANLAAKQHSASTVAQTGLQTTGIELALHIAQTDAHVGGVNAIDLVVSGRHSQRATERAQALHREVTLVDDQLLDTGRLGKDQRGCGRAQPGRHLKVDRTAEGIDGHRPGGIERDRVAKTLQADAARGLQRITSALPGRARNGHGQLAIAQAGTRTGPADGAVDIGRANEQVVRCRLDMAREARDHAWQRPTRQAARGHQMEHPCLRAGMNRDVVGPNLRHAGQASLQQDTDFTGQLAAQIELLGPAVLPTQAQAHPIGQPVAQAQVQRLQLAKAQKRHVAPSQGGHKGHIPAACTVGHLHIALTNASEGLQRRLQCQGRDTGGQRCRALATISQGKHARTCGCRDSLGLRAGGSIGDARHLRCRCPLDLGDFTAHDPNLPTQGTARKAHLPLLVAQAADKGDLRITAARSKAGLIADGGQQGAAQLRCRGVEGDVGGAVGDAVVSE